ncbi:MAG: hypothetical protein HY290_02725, partial [Planctomycetia bacterium]|nr:hypothetical protein [Planctomycetia bacterium]
MSDIRNPKLLYLKGALFLILGLMAAGILLGPSLFGMLVPEAFQFVFP